MAKAKKNHRRRKLLTRSVTNAKETAKQQGPSKETKQMKLLRYRVSQDRAFEELMKRRAKSWGSSSFGDIQFIVDKYQRNGCNVQRHHLEYRIQLCSTGLNLKHPVQEVVYRTLSTISPITNRFVGGSPNPDEVPPNADDVPPNIPDEVAPKDQEVPPIDSDDEEESDGSADVSTTSSEDEETTDTTPLTNKGGRPKGTTKKAKKDYKRKVQLALTKASRMYLDMKKKLV